MRCRSASSALATGSVRRPLWLCLAFAAAATGREVRQSPLFRVAAAIGRAWRFRGLLAFFDLAGHLGLEFKDSVFGVTRLGRGGFAVS